MSDEEKTSQGTSTGQLKGGVDTAPDEGGTGQESKKSDLYTHQYNQLIARHGALNDSFNRIITSIAGVALAISVTFLTDFNEPDDHFLVRSRLPFSWIFLGASIGCMLKCIHITTENVERLVKALHKKEDLVGASDVEGKDNSADCWRNTALFFLLLGIACVLVYGAMKFVN